jgi:hypothetical protein
MWKTKVEEWIASLIPYINVPLDQYDPTEWKPEEISSQFLEDVDGKSELITLLNPQLTYNETTTGYMIKLRTMIDLLELLEKRGVNVEQYVIRRKEIPETPSYKGPLQTMQLEMADVFIAKADQNALIIWEQSLPFQSYSNVPWEVTNEYIVIDNLLIDIQKQRVLAELKTEEERKVWNQLGCDFKPTKRKFSKSIRAKLDETRKSARQDDLQ